jgi:NitT/TauT family transport system ATP-binding protein
MSDRTDDVSGQDLLVDRLSVVYQGSRGALTALRDFSFSMDTGEFVAVLGPSGCGKSTLLRLISGLRQPTEGRVVLAGEPVVGPRPDVGIVFQQPTLLPWKTVLNNVLVPIHAMRRRDRDYVADAMDLLRLVGLEEFARSYPGELSGGMQQRVGLARGLIHNPRVLLMDEPFAALDAMTREQMMIELQRIWMAARKSVVFITHSIPEAVFLADRVIVVSPRPGRVLEEVRIDLPRPRTMEVTGDPGFVAVANHLRGVFQGMLIDNGA